MKTRILLPVLLLALPAAAQMGPGPGGPESPAMMVPPLGVDFVFETGAWAEYTMARGPMQVLMRFAVVGQEKCGEKTCHWLEIKMKMPGGEVPFKMLVSGDPREQSNLKKMLVKPPGREPQEIPVGQLAGGGGPGAPPAPKPDFKDVGKEQIKVGDKNLETTHLRAAFQGMAMDAYVSKEVKLFGLVRLQAPAMTMELTGFGKGAKPSF